jgi:hypothetical protein
MTDANCSKEELRKRLREKIKQKRHGGNNETLRESMLKDPQTTMMRMGIDDVNILQNANNILKNPNEILKTLTEAQDTDKQKVIEDSDEEDLPPLTDQ